MRGHNFAHFFIIIRSKKGLRMETLLGLFVATFLRAILPFSHLLQREGTNQDFEIWRNDSSGVFYVSMAVKDKKFWNFQVFCPEEWTKWLRMETSTLYRTLGKEFENGSATTRPQLYRMELFNGDRQPPSYFDLSSIGINVVVASALYPEQGDLEKVKELLLLELERKL